MSSLGNGNNQHNINSNTGSSQNSAAEGTMERGSCILVRYASQNSLDESSQKQLPRSNGKEKTTGAYRNNIHTQRSFEAMNMMREQNLLCDVVLVAEGIEIPAHKMVLASCSPYFYAMFTGFEESRQDRITLQGVDPRALQLLIEYVYRAVVEVTEDNVQILLTAANLLQLTDVRDACCDYLQTQLDPSNCLGIRDFADIHGCIDLLNYAETYIEQHFSEVVQFDEFLNLTGDQVAHLIKSDRLSVPTEEKVYECVIAWIQYDVNGRQHHLADLMEHVRLPLLSQDYLVQYVEKEQLMKGDLQCKDYIIEALKYHLLKGEQKTCFKTPRTIPRQPVGLPKVLLVIGGQAPKAIRSVECYDLREEKWYQVAEMPTRRCRAGLAVLGDKVYAVGGFNGSLRVKTVDVYDPVLDQWTTSHNMEARRSTLGVAVLNNCIYAVGGFDGSTGLSSAEMFDPKRQEWRLIASMSTRRSSVGVGVVNGLLYAVGGYDGASRQCLASVERYNPSTDTWTQIAEMSARRSGAGVGVLDNILYAVGGHDGPLVRKSVEAYDPATNTWRAVGDMAFCRRNAGVVAHNGMLYVVGGDDGLSNLASVEVYSPETDSWRILPSSMSIGRSYAGVAMIDKPFEQQGARAAPKQSFSSHHTTIYSRYANCAALQSEAAGLPAAAAASGGNDDENSQAEGLNPEPVNNGANGNNVHYENIYESIEQFAPLNGGGNGGVGGNGAPAGIPAVSNPLQHAALNQPQPGPSGLASGRTLNGGGGVAGGVAAGGCIPPPPPSMLHSMQQLYHPMAYRNELYDRTAGYDVPRGRPAPSYYQNQPPAGSSNGRYSNLHLDLNRVRYPSASVSQQQQRTPRQRSFDDTESYHYYRYQSQSNGVAKYDNLYERVREEPAYQNTGSFAPAANRAAGLFGRFDVIGHGVGRIERHLSSSCGNIDHYSLGGHYAVLGHSHLGTVGHIRLNQPGSNGPGSVVGGASNTSYCTNGSTAAQANPTKDSSSVNVKSFFSCLGGENSQSMNNLNKSSTTNGMVNGAVAAANGNDNTLAGGGAGGSSGASGGNSGQGGSIMGGLASAAAVGVSGVGTSGTISGKSTGAIPKINRKSKQSLQSVASDVIPNVSAAPSLAAVGGLPPADLSAGTADPMYANGVGGRVTKPSLQWLLVNKWLPLWVGQTPPDYKFIDFNFMFSRNCDGCSTTGLHGQQELVRYGTIDQADYIPPAREYPTMTGSYPRVLRNTPQLARLREHEYENVPLNDPPARGTRAGPSLQPLRARSESPNRAASTDPLRNWAFNFENNTFRPARSPALTVGSTGMATSGAKPHAVRRITDGTFGTREIQQQQQPDAEKPGPSGLAGKFAGMKRIEPDREDGRLSSASSSSDSDNFAIESLAAESGGQPEEEEEEEEGSTRSGDVRAANDGMRVGISAEKENTGTSSNDTSDSLNYDGPEPEVADRSFSEDEVDLAVACCAVVVEEAPDNTVSE
uniref:BTB domain-containing protein n=1 Tax=Anopheles christyi TaxID=43041 RepID=A0A182K984_9DIPT